MNINFINIRKKSYLISTIFAIISIIAILFIPKQLWIDMTWWTQSVYSYSSDINIDDIRDKVSSESKLYPEINWNNVYSVSGKDNFVIETWFNTDSVSSDKLDEIKKEYDSKILSILKSDNSSIIREKYISIWETFWEYIKNRALVTLIIAVVMISLYIAWAFRSGIKWIASHYFASITVITLFHDVLITVWIYIIISLLFPELKIDTYLVTALLTILWYSINDTIVILDRIRWEIKKLDDPENPNKSKFNINNMAIYVQDAINKTLTRSIYTSFTLVIVLFAMVIFAPTPILGFVIALIIWTLIWTYSSVFIAAPLLYDFASKKRN